MLHKLSNEIIVTMISNEFVNTLKNTVEEDYGGQLKRPANDGILYCDDMDCHSSTPSTLSDEEEEQAESEEEEDVIEAKTIFKVSSVESIVMGYETTVEDEEHYHAGKRKTGMGMSRFLMKDDEFDVESYSFLRRFTYLTLDSVCYLVKLTRSLSRRQRIPLVYAFALVSMVYLGQKRVNNNWSGSTHTRESQHSGVAGKVSVSAVQYKTGREIASKGAPPPPNTEIPFYFNHFADTSTPRDASDIPFFWHTPRSGSTTVKNMMSVCFGKVLASDLGGVIGAQPQKLSLVKLGNVQVVNVDLSSIEGIQRAKALQLVENNLADAIASPFISDASVLFNPNHQARLFALFRHPVHRSASLFYHQANAVWLPTYDPQLSKMSLLEYAQSPRVEHNSITRLLSGQATGTITEHHLNIAKEVLRRKCLVGVLERKQETVVRLAEYFAWDHHKQHLCVQNYLKNWSRQNNHPVVQEDSAEWNTLMMQNGFDMELYMYVNRLFDEQASLISKW